MKTIDLQRIMDRGGFKTTQMGKLLFPSNKYPNVALKRVLNGETLLDSDQIIRLASFLGVAVSELYGVHGWKYKTENGIYKMENGDFTAELDTKSWTTKIFHKDSVFHEEVIHEGTTTLSEYVTKLNELITKFKNDE